VTRRHKGTPIKAKSRARQKHKEKERVLSAALTAAQHRSARLAMADETDKPLLEAVASTGSGPSPMKPRSSIFSLEGPDDYTGVPQEVTDSSHGRHKSADMRLTASLRESDLGDSAADTDKPMRRSVSWPDWSENWCV
jgi:hypothetical protein